MPRLSEPGHTVAINENIELSLPVNAAYVSAARLTASSIAGRLGFDADEIEDIKTAVSEACTYIIKKLTVYSNEPFKIIFFLRRNYLGVRLDVRAKSSRNGSKEDYALKMINALMDDVSITSENGAFNITMSKAHKVSEFVT